MLASLFAREASHLNDVEFSCPYEIASHLWVGHVPFWLPSTEGKFDSEKFVVGPWFFDSEEFVVGPWFLRLSCVLLVATMLPCAGALLVHSVAYGIWSCHPWPTIPCSRRVCSLSVL